MNVYTGSIQTFPEEDLAIGAMVQDKAVSGLQHILREGVLTCHQSDRHVSAGIGHLNVGFYRALHPATDFNFKKIF